MDDEAPSALMQLCLGKLDRDAINMRQANRIAEAMNDPLMRWVIARDGDTKKTASFAQWQFPKADGQDKEDAEMSETEMVSCWRS